MTEPAVPPSPSSRAPSRATHLRVAGRSSSLGRCPSRSPSPSARSSPASSPGRRRSSSPIGTSSSTSSRRAPRTSSCQPVRHERQARAEHPRSSSRHWRSARLLGLVARTTLVGRVAGVFVAVGVVALFASLRSGVLGVAARSSRSPWRSAPRCSRCGCSSRGHRRRTSGSGPNPALARTARARPAHRPPGGMPDWDRRRFLILSAALRRRSVVVGSIGRALLPGRPSSASPWRPTCRRRASSRPRCQPDASLAVDGHHPDRRCRTTAFYRIDTALVVPRVDVATWKVTVKGMVDAPVTLTYDSSRRCRLFEQYVTIACVSNEVGGDLVGNALWTRRPPPRRARDGRRPSRGDPDRRALGRRVHGRLPDRLGDGPGARPDDRPRDERRAAAGRARLPGAADRPRAVRLRRGDEVAGRDRADDAGGVRRLLGPARLVEGGADPDPVADRRAPRRVRAWAPVPSRSPGSPGRPTGASSKVEVRVDEGAWLPATLSAAMSKATWVQWRVGWDATAGDHTIEVRATDGTGEVQTDQITPPPPDGARGHHTIRVRVG